MEKPLIADHKPIKTELEVGETYYWCACGKSAQQPFCDGSHQGSSFTPKPFEAEESGAAYFCMCKLTRNPPYCDGSHKSIGATPSDPGGETKASNLATPTPEEPQVAFIHELAENGLSRTQHHGEVGAMGIPGPQLPRWDDIQILTAQLATKPLLDNVEVGTELVIGRNAKKPLVLAIPLLVSDMSFGALSTA